jgi:hypothetical protein
LHFSHPHSFLVFFLLVNSHGIKLLFKSNSYHVFPDNSSAPHHPQTFCP